MLNKQKIEKFLAFTLAEVLITMVVITMITLASIPVIKKQKDIRESTKDKNYWVAMYEGNDIKVSTNIPSTDGGKASDSTGKFAKFIPPKGVTRFNVTVVGGGGGGAAGEAGIGTTKTYFPEGTGDADAFSTTFMPVSDGLYQIVAIGGGGGGGGGGAFKCRGTGGWSGGAVMATAYLYKDKIYNVSAGQYAIGGNGQSVGGVIFGGILPVASVVAGIASGGLAFALGGAIAAASSMGAGALSSAVSSILAPSSPTDGGGSALPSVFVGHGVKIIASGGCGGQYNRKKVGAFYVKCKKCGGCEGTKFANSMCEGTNSCASTGSQRQDGGRSGGWVCKNSSNCILSGLGSAFEGIDPTQFGNGGDGGGAMANGRNGKPGVVQIKEIPVYGGGGGQAGAVSFYSYQRSPLDKDSTEEFVRAYPGLGGTGGASNGLAGKDGTFSRFGTRIIADGGTGGRTRESLADENTMKAPGQNGAETTIPASTLKLIKMKGESIMFGGYSDKNSDINGQGKILSGAESIVPMPGAGGAGGGAQGSKNFNQSEVKSGLGGNGAPGIIIVTW